LSSNKQVNDKKNFYHQMKLRNTVMNTQIKTEKHAVNATSKISIRKIHKQIILILIAVAAPVHTAMSQQTLPCTPYPLCLTTPQQAAINLLNNLPSRISNNRFVQGGFIPGLRSQISPLLDARFPAFPFQNYYLGYGAVSPFYSTFQGGVNGGSAFAPINFQAIDQKYGGLFSLGNRLLGFN
jgi:hypothetical protein